MMRLSSRTFALLSRYQLAALALACMGAARVGHNSLTGVVEGGVLVAANLWMNRRLLAWVQPTTGPTAGRLLAVALIKLVAQLGLATSMLVWYPPAPAAFLAGLATFLVALLATALHSSLRLA